METVGSNGIGCACNRNFIVMASLQADQQAEGGGEPSSNVDGVEKEISDTEHAQKSKVETASSTDACKKQPDTVDHPLTLHWTFGLNSTLPVHNISDPSRKMVFYVSGHSGVLLDCESNTQCLLQGHSNSITSTAVSGDKRWLVTGDSGPSNPMITIWDSYSAIPVRSIFECIGEGCQVVAMSTDAKYIAVITAGTPQELCVWEWTVESEEPLCRTTISTDYGHQRILTFHPSDSSQLVSNSDDTVVFYHWSGSRLSAHSTTVSDRDFNKPLGVLTQSVFIPGTQLAITANTEGSAVIWEDLTPPQEGGVQLEPHKKRPLKLIKLHDCPITVLTTAANLLVSGDCEGQVKFFDSELKMLNWYDGDPSYGYTVSISFAHHPKLHKRVEEGHFYPPESTLPASPFVIPDFTVSTSSAVLLHVKTNGSVSEVLLREHEAAVNALATHPTLTHLLIGSYSCKLKLWNYQTKEVVCVRTFKEANYVQCVAYDPKGHHIGVGFTNGLLGVLDSTTLEDVCQPFRFSRDAITQIVFSHDSAYMATADLDMCVSVYVSRANDEGQPWQLFARHKAHYGKIEDLMFGVKLDSSAPRLLSISSDRTIVEYDLLASGVDDLKLLSTDRIEQSAVPTAMAWYPQLTKESFILVANDQFKLKLFNSTTKMCRKTLLGPTFGSPLRKLLVLPAPIKRDGEGQEIRRYLAYITTDKVGLLLLPHDGNPHNSQCLIAHPRAVSELACSHDGQYVFTAGGDDCTVNMWTVSTQALESLSLLGGEDLEPFYAMLDGGREGEFFAELEEYFYYAQIKSQGPNTMATRQISTHIPLEQIPFVMRAIGFYPSEQEIEEMLNEVKFSEYIQTRSNVTQIDLGDFIKLYVNHRPAFGLSPSALGRAFRQLGERVGGDQRWTIDRATLLSLLQEKGEHLTEVELVECLMTLLGCSDNPEMDGCFSEDMETALSTHLPERLAPADLAEGLLGLAIQ